MQLTRRDALAALSAVGAGTVAGCEAPTATDREPTEGEADLLATLTAAAETLYPSAVEGHRAFVEAYVLGRLEDRPDHRSGVEAAVATLEEAARDWYGSAFPDLDRETRDRLLREVGADTAEPVPEGTVSERVRYFVVNELLFAFYASPTGGELVGIENPVGHPGGIESYQHGPPADSDEGDGD